MWDIHAHMETPRRSARAQVRETSKLPALSLSLALAKKIHNPLFRRVAGLIVRACGCADARASTLSCACTRIAPPGRVIHPSATYG